MRRRARFVIGFNSFWRFRTALRVSIICWWVSRDLMATSSVDLGNLVLQRRCWLNRAAVFALLVPARPAVVYSSVNVVTALAALPKIHIASYTMVRLCLETVAQYAVFALVVMAQPTKLGFS